MLMSTHITEAVKVVSSIEALFLANNNDGGNNNNKPFPDLCGQLHPNIVLNFSFFLFSFHCRFKRG